MELEWEVALEVDLMVCSKRLIMAWEVWEEWVVPEEEANNDLWTLITSV